MKREKNILPVRKIIGLIFFLPAALLTAAQEENKTEAAALHGYVKDLQGISFSDRSDSLHSVNLLHNRLNFKINFSAGFSARLEIRNRMFWGDQLKMIPDFGNVINKYTGLVNLSHLWVNRSYLVIHSVADRLMLQYRAEQWDISAGRQRINWGVSNIWNPNDIFNAYNFLDFDYEERPGNDAIRVQHFLKTNATLELACKPGRHGGETVAGLLYKFNYKKYDWQMLGGIAERDAVAGFGWAGSIKEAGFKGELSYFHPQKNFLDSSGVISLSVMADRTFKNDWYVSLAFLYNSNPAGVVGNSGNIFAGTVSAKQIFPYRYSFYTGMMKTFTPVTTLNFSIIYSPERNTVILFPAFAWNAAKNLDLDIIAQSVFARLPYHYRTQGTSIFLRGKWSF